VIAIDNVGERLGLAGSWGKAETIASFDPDEIYERLMEMTNGRGPDSCIDAVGAEAHGHGVGDAIADKAKSLTRLPLPHPHVLQQIARCCRKGGTLSVPGVYLGYANMFPIGGIMNKGLTLKTGQTHMQRYLAPLLDRVLAGEIDLSRVITHRLPLSEAPRAYRMFQEKNDGCIKVVMTP